MGLVGMVTIMIFARKRKLRAGVQIRRLELAAAAIGGVSRIGITTIDKKTINPTFKILSKKINFSTSSSPSLFKAYQVGTLIKTLRSSLKTLSPTPKCNCLPMISS